MMIKWYWIVLAVIITTVLVYFYFNKREKNIVKDINTKLSEDNTSSSRLVGEGLVRRCNCYIPPSKIVGVNGEWGKIVNGVCVSCNS